jgi:hypothetical protein
LGPRAGLDVGEKKNLSLLRNRTKLFKVSVFWDIKSCSPLNANRSFGGRSRLHLQVEKSQGRNEPEIDNKQSLLVSRVAYPSTLKFEEACSSETTVDSW